MVAVNRGRSQRKEVAKITHPKSLQKTRKHVHAEDSDYRGECESEDADESESEYSGNTESETSSSEAEIADARTQSLNMREAQIDERNMSVAEKRKRAQAKQDDFYTERLPLAWRKKVPPAGPKALLKSFRNPRLMSVKGHHTSRPHDEGKNLTEEHNQKKHTEWNGVYKTGRGNKMRYYSIVHVGTRAQKYANERKAFFRTPGRLITPAHAAMIHDKILIALHGYIPSKMNFPKDTSIINPKQEYRREGKDLKEYLDTYLSKGYCEREVRFPLDKECCKISAWDRYLKYKDNGWTRTEPQRIMHRDQKKSNLKRPPPEIGHYRMRGQESLHAKCKKAWAKLYKAHEKEMLHEAARHLREDILNSDDEEREYFLKPRDRPYKLDSVIETKKTYEHVTNHGFKLCHDFTKDYAEIRRRQKFGNPPDHLPPIFTCSRCRSYTHGIKDCPIGFLGQEIPIEGKNWMNQESSVRDHTPLLESGHKMWVEGVQDHIKEATLEIIKLQRYKWYNDVGPDKFVRPPDIDSAFTTAILFDEMLHSHLTRERPNNTID